MAGSRRGWPTTGAFAGHQGSNLAPVVAGVVALVPALLVVVQTARSGFVQDDIINLREAQLDSLSPGYLVEATSGHFAPGHRFGDWMLQTLFPFDFFAAQVVLAVVFAASLYVLFRILQELDWLLGGASGRWPLIVTLVYGLSMVHVGVMQWWASGLDRVPATLFSFLSILCYLRFHRTRSLQYLVGSLGTLAVALLFYVKPVFVPFYLVLLRVLVLEPDRPLRETVREVCEEWRLWLGYASIVGAYLILYLQAYPSYATDRSVGAVGGYLGTLWSRVFVPNLFGLYVPQGELTPVLLAGILLAQGLLAGTVVWSLRRSRTAWRAWAFFVVAALPNALAIGLTRITVLSPATVAYATFFNLELVILFFVSLAIAISLAPRRSPDESRRPAFRSVERWLPGVSALVLAVYLASSSWGGWRLSQPGVWHGVEARTYVDHIQDDLSRARRDGAKVALVDGIVAPGLSVLLAPPWNNLSEVVPLFDDQATFDSAGRDLFRVSPAGRLEPVSFVPESGGSVPAQFDDGTMAVIGATPRITDSEYCISPGEGKATVGLEPATPFDGEISIELGYSASERSTITMAPDPLPATVLETLEIPRYHVIRHSAPGHHTRVIQLGGVRMDRLALDIDPGSEVCFDTLRIGRLVPRE